MRNAILHLILVVTFFLTATATQSYKLKVLAAKGEVEFIPTAKSGKIVLKTGSEINTGGVIVLDDKEYLSLTHSSGQLVELKKRGRYTVNEIETEISKKNSTFTGKFVEFVGEKLTGSGKKTKEMKLTGAVVRVRDDYLFVDLPSQSRLLSDSIRFDFEAVDTTLEYFLFVFNNDNQLVLVKELSKGAGSLGNSDIRLIEEKKYKLVIKGMGHSELISDTIIVSPAGKNLSHRMRDSVSALSDSAGTNQSPLQAVCLAILYEQNQFFVDAYAMYRLAISQIEGVEEFENLYLEFLFNNGLSYKGEQFIIERSKPKS